MSTAPALRADLVAAATPAHRDRTIDAVRVLSLLVVVLGHWLMAEVTVTDGTARVSNLLDRIPALQLVTWALQVMPLFFVAGGFANATVWRRASRDGEGYAHYLRSRVGRLVVPVLVFAGLAQTGLLIARAAGLPADAAGQIARACGQPLWFLGVYVVLTALAPPMLRWHERTPVGALATLVLAATTVEALRMATGLNGIAYLNLLGVWLFAQQLGFWYADGRLSQLSRGVLSGAVAGGLLGLALLTSVGPYPVSMVGVGTGMSNMDPPSICLVLLTITQTAALMLVRQRLAAVLERPRVWLAVVTGGAMAMSIYLWHLVAGIGVVVLAVALDVQLPAGGTLLWWATRPLWLVVLAAALIALVVPVSRLERRCLPRPVGGTGSMPRLVAGVVLTAVGLVGYTLNGLEPFGPGGSWFGLPGGPVPSSTCLVVGLILVTRRAGGSPTSLVR